MYIEIYLLFIGTDGPESPLLGYLEQESAAVSNIKEETSTPDNELDRLENLVKHPKANVAASEKEQQRLIYGELKKLLKEQEAEEQDANSGKIKQTSLQRQQLLEQMRQEKLAMDLTKDLDNDKNKEKLVDQLLSSTYFKTNGNLLKEFRKFMKIHRKPNKGLIKDSNNVEAVMKQQSSNNIPAFHGSKKMGETANSIEDQLKEIQLQKEMLKNREERLKKLSAQTMNNNPVADPVEDPVADPLAKLKESTEESVDHKLQLANPNIMNYHPENDETLSGQHDDPDNAKISDHKLHLTQEALTDMGESNIEIKPEDLESEDIHRLDLASGIARHHKPTQSMHQQAKVTVNFLASNQIIQTFPSPSPVKVMRSPESKSVKDTDEIRASENSEFSIKEPVNKVTDKTNNSKTEKENTEDTANSTQTDSQIHGNNTQNNKVAWKEVKMIENDSENDSSKAVVPKEVPLIQNTTSGNSTSGNTTDEKPLVSISKNISISENKTRAKEKEEENVGLPINNPKPGTDVGYQPHANFHNTFHSHPTTHFESSRFISPIHSPIRHTEPMTHSAVSTTHEHKFYGNYQPSTGSLLKIKHFRHKAPSIMNNFNSPLGSNFLPPAGMGKPRFTHVTDIMEPPLISYRTDANHRAVFNNPNVNFFSSPRSANTFSNLLKHKEIPTAHDKSLKENNNVESESIKEEESARYIKPKSSRNRKVIDVTASKKGFGTLPKKPKSYYIKEIKHKLHLLALKQNIEKHLLKRLRHHPKLYAWDNYTEDKKNLNNFSTDSSGDYDSTFLVHKNKSNVLVPLSSKEPIKNLTKENKNIIIPGSKYKLLNGPKKSTEDSNSANPGDITRSILPKANDTFSSFPDGQPSSIEDVFKVLGSDNQIIRRSIIPERKHYKRSKYVAKYRPSK